MKLFLTLFLFSWFFSNSIYSVSLPSSVIDISASSFQLDSKTHLLKAEGPVIVKQEGIVITGEDALYDERKEIVVLTGKVKVVSGGLEMLCRKVVLKGLEKWLTVKGSVSLKYSSKQTTDTFVGNAKQVFYNMVNETLNITGLSYFKYGADQIEGDRLFIDLKQSRVVAKGDAKILISKNRLKDL